MEFIHGTLYVIATPIGNLGDITNRALEALNAMDVIFCEDTRVTRKLLDKYNIHNKKLYLYNKDNENEKHYDFVLTKIKVQECLVGLVTDAGTPCISDPGSKLIKFLYEKNINIDFLPGPCALINGLVLSGICFDSFSFLGFIPKENEKRKEFIENISDINQRLKLNHVFVFHETASRLEATLTSMLEILGNQEICIAKELTKMHQKIFKGNIMDFKDIQIKGEVVLILNFINQDHKDNLANLDSEIKDMLNKDFSINDISRIISQKFNISKNKAYKIVCEIKQDHKILFAPQNIGNDI